MLGVSLEHIACRESHEKATNCNNFVLDVCKQLLCIKPNGNATSEAFVLLYFTVVRMFEVLSITSEHGEVYAETMLPCRQSLDNSIICRTTFLYCSHISL